MTAIYPLDGGFAFYTLARIAQRTSAPSGCSSATGPISAVWLPVRVI